MHEGEVNKLTSSKLTMIDAFAIEKNYLEPKVEFLIEYNVSIQSYLQYFRSNNEANGSENRGLR